jgi:nucleoid-associated protein YgaU
MTSDAKIGLLLGFVFILVIISLVNGLPGLIGKDSSNRVLDTSAHTYDDTYDLDGKANEVVQFLDDLELLKGKKRQSGTNDDPRFEEGRKVVKSNKEESSDKKLTASNDKKFYVVQKYDVLGRISIKVYGEEIGKKQATIDLIYQANLSILDSPDDIKAGQKLIIPSLDEEQEPASGKGSVTAKKTTGPIDKLTKAVKNVFGKNRKSSPLHVTYVVKDADSLWQIASRRLGNGSRWREIQKINKSILNGSKVVAPGMKLKMPQK